MRATDLIRSVLCVIDQIEQKEQQAEIPASATISVSVPPEEVHQADVVEPGFKQIFDLLSGRRHGQYANSPTETVAGIDSVTKDAGAEGWNGTKHPADLRVKDPSMYPNSQLGSQ